MTKESAEKLAAKILYLLDCQGLVEIRGNTNEEVQENIKRAREIDGADDYERRGEGN